MVILVAHRSFTVTMSDAHSVALNILLLPCLPSPMELLAELPRLNPGMKAKSRLVHIYYPVGQWHFAQRTRWNTFVNAIKVASSGAQALIQG